LRRVLYRAAAIHHLNAHALTGYFDAVVTKEDCPSGKPAPDPLVTAAARLKITPGDCWALEDFLNGALSAHRAGMKTFMVPDLVSPNDEVRDQCFMIASSLFDVLELLVNRAIR
jgi:beta-phosphoglucomutase-like phosphatase (HAD superfamily)